jgi:hypothetical protein
MTQIEIEQVLEKTRAIVQKYQAQVDKWNQRIDIILSLVASALEIPEGSQEEELFLEAMVNGWSEELNTKITALLKNQAENV